MDRLLITETELRQLSPQSLSFVGDAVYGLMVRERLVRKANRAVGELHRLSVEQVRKEAQAAVADKLAPLLTSEEQAVFKRGRNAHTTRTGGDYHTATGLEALFGWLYLGGQMDRLRELFALAMEELQA